MDYAEILYVADKTFCVPTLPSQQILLVFCRPIFSASNGVCSTTTSHEIHPSYLSASDSYLSASDCLFVLTPLNSEESGAASGCLPHVILVYLRVCHPLLPCWCRSVAANSYDQIYCMQLAQNAVHGAMAGYTAFSVGMVNDRTVSRDRFLLLSLGLSGVLELRRALF